MDLHDCADGHLHAGSSNFYILLHAGSSNFYMCHLSPGSELTGCLGCQNYWHNNTALQLTLTLRDKVGTVLHE